MIQVAPMTTGRPHSPTWPGDKGRGAGPFGRSMHVARPCLQTNDTPKRMRHWPSRPPGRSFSQTQGACAEVSTSAPQRLWRLSFRLGSRVVLGECSAAGLKVRWGCLRLWLPARPWPSSLLPQSPSEPAVVSPALGPVVFRRAPCRRK